MDPKPILTVVLVLTAITVVWCVVELLLSFLGLPSVLGLLFDAIDSTRS